MNWKKLAPWLVFLVIIIGIGGAMAVLNAPAWTTQRGSAVDCPPANDYEVCTLTHPVGSTIEVLTAFSPDGNVLITAGGSLARGWNMTNGSQLFEFNVGAGFKGVAFLPDGKHFVGANGAAIRVWQLSDQQAITIISDQRNFDQLAVSPDGQYVVGSTNFEIKLWRISDGELVHVLRTGQTLVRSMAFSPDGRYLAVGRTNNPVEVYDVEKAELAFSIPQKNVVSLEFTPDGQQLLLAHGKKVSLWSFENQELVRDWQENDYDIVEITLSANGEYIVSGTSRGVFVRSLSDDNVLTTLFNDSRVGALTFSPNDTIFAVSGMSRTVRLWHLPI